jgi:cell wall-associated NlpC family hydrolase
MGIALAAAPTAVASTGSTGGEAAPAGGTQAAPPPPGPAPAGVTPGATIPGTRAKIGPDGQALAPADAPDQVKYAIWAGNQLQDKPYEYGGGHQDFVDTGYDCSGTVSYALHGAGLLDTPMDSSDLEGWGEEGPGQWITPACGSTRAGPATRAARTARAGASGCATTAPTTRATPSAFSQRPAPIE